MDPAERVFLQGVLVERPDGSRLLRLLPYSLEASEDGRAVWLLNEQQPDDALCLSPQDPDTEVAALAEAALLLVSPPLALTRLAA